MSAGRKGNTHSGQAELLHRESREIVEKHIEEILIQLARPSPRIDAERVKETLLELSAHIRSRSSVFQGSDYRWILEQLTGIWAQGFANRTAGPFATTAAAYAKVIETISHAYPGQDYCRAVAQLFGYMIRLFRTQESSWKAVYEHILSIPDSVEAKRLLDRVFLVEIQEWAEAGVGNLFSIRSNLYRKIGELAVRIEELDQRIAKIEREAKRHRQVWAARYGPNVIDLSQVHKRALMTSLAERRQGLADDKRGEEIIVAMIESDIREFEDKLRNIARACFVRSI